MRLDYALIIIETIEKYFFKNFNVYLDRSDLSLVVSLDQIEEGYFFSLIGDIKGRIHIQFSHELVIFISTNLLTSVKEELTLRSNRENLQKIVELVAENVIQQMANEDYSVEIGEIYFVNNSNYKIDLFDLETLVIEYTSQAGLMQVNVALETVE